MSDITVDKINNLAGTGAANFTYGIKVGGVAQSIGAGTFTSSDTEPTSPSDGDVWYQPTLMYLDYRAGGEWKRVVGSGTSNPLPYFGDRMLVGGGQLSSSKTNAIRYIDITSNGGSTSFGTLSASKSKVSGASGDGRGLFAGGNPSGTFTDAIEYVTISTTGNGSSFGTLSQTTATLSSASNGTTAIFTAGNNSFNQIEKVTIATTGNASSWSGSLTVSRVDAAGASDGTKGFFIGGVGSPYFQNVIDYVTIATEANAADWGDLITARNGTGGNGACGNTSRTLVFGGYTASNTTDSIEYFSPAYAGNAYSFGNLTASRRLLASACNATKAVCSTGYTGSAYTNLQNIVTIDTTGNASAFGTYSVSVGNTAGLSGAAS